MTSTHLQEEIRRAGKMVCDGGRVGEEPVQRQLMREKLTTGVVPFRKAYLGSIVDRIEVDDREIRIVGRKDVLEQAVLANGGRCREFAVLFANGAP